MSATSIQLGQRVRPPTRVEVDARRSRDQAVGFTVGAVAIAFTLFLMPSSRHDYREVWFAALLGAGLIGLTLLWDRSPPLVAVGLALGYLGLAAVLRDAAGGSSSGFGGLFLLPVLWVALTAGGIELTAVLLGLFLAQLVPLTTIGAPAYPASGWRAAVVLTSVAAIAGAMVVRLVGDARRRAEILQQQATSLGEATERLAEQNERLLELDRMKDEFVAVLSHELRTPLTSISGYLEMALDDAEEPIPPTQQEYLAIVRRNVDRLIALVNQLLFLARAEAHGVELERQAVDVQEVLQEAADTAKPAAEAKAIELSVEAAPLPSVLADRAQILRLIDNLVSNAVKFTAPGGRVRIAAHHHRDAVVVEVVDSGVGIPAYELPLLFERFSRASNATRGAVPGTGLGLAISQMIAEAHGSKIQVESTPGVGTAFSFTLPAAA